MITAYMQGGLGNQMFQYAFGLEQARRFNTDLFLDTTAFHADPMRRFNLDLFAGITEWHGRRLTGRVIHEVGLPHNQAVIDSIKGNEEDVTLRGYWQSEKYFPNVALELREKFVPKDPLPQLFVPNLLDRIAAAGNLSTFIGIRRTDYVKKQDFHGVLGTDYYSKALQILTNRLGKAPTVFVFSDEPEWCKQNFRLPIPFTVAGSYNWTTPTNRGREDVDIYAMSKCYNAIIANSTFHWWGAWMGSRDPNRTVIAPEKWFTTSQVDSRDIVPERWIKI